MNYISNNLQNNHKKCMTNIGSISINNCLIWKYCCLKFVDSNVVYTSIHFLCLCSSNSTSLPCQLIIGVHYITTKYLHNHSQKKWATVGYILSARTSNRKRWSPQTYNLIKLTTSVISFPISLRWFILRKSLQYKSLQDSVICIS